MDHDSVPSTTPQPRTATRIRQRAAVIAAACACLVAAATYLTPDPRGLGTHEQLGLPPCISSNYLGAPCPLCGMTTAFTLMAHARPRDAFRAQPAGAAFFVLCVIALAGALSTLALGHTPNRAASFVQGRFALTTATVLLAAAWLYKLVAFYR